MSDDDSIIIMVGTGYRRGDWIEIDGVLYEVIEMVGRHRMKLKPLPWWWRNLRTIIALVFTAVLIGFVVSNARAHHDGGDVMLGLSTQPSYTLAECDEEWRKRGHKPPRAAIVVNQTVCEPKLPCKYRGGQVYQRTCRMGVKRHG